MGTMKMEMEIMEAIKTTTIIIITITTTTTTTTTLTTATTTLTTLTTTTMTTPIMSFLMRNSGTTMRRGNRVTGHAMSRLVIRMTIGPLRSGNDMKRRVCMIPVIAI